MRNNSKKGPVIKNINKKNRHGTNCNDENRVIVGASGPLPYTFSVQKSISHYIMKYDLKCSILQFPQKMNMRVLATENKLSQEFISALANYFDWNILCEKQKLSESFMKKHSNRISWKIASAYQSFSKDFILRNKDKLDMDVIMNKRFLISQEEIDEYNERQKQFETYDKKDKIDSRFDILDLS